MKSMPLIWFDANDDTCKCSFCHGFIDKLKKRVVISSMDNFTLARFHDDCYEAFYRSAIRYEAFPENAEWEEPFVSRYGRW